MPGSSGMFDFLDKEVNSWQGLQILDTACGNGLLAQEMVAKGANVTAMECEPTVLAQAMELSRRERQKRNPYFIQGGLDDLPGEPASFQMILCLSNATAALADSQGYTSFFHRVAELLTPKGRLVLQLFNYDRILRYDDYELEDITLPEEGILIKRSFQPQEDGFLDLVSRIRILRKDAFEMSTHTSRVWPISSDDLKSSLQEAGFVKITFYSDVAGHSWQADSFSSLLIAVRA